MCHVCDVHIVYVCRLLMAAGIAGMPLLTANKGAKEFIRHQESWWNWYTECVNFSKQTHQSKRRFNFQVQTDGISVSGLMFRPFPKPPLQTNTAAATPPPPGRKRKRHSRAEQSSRTTTGECVQGLPDRHLMQPARIVGLDPGRRALFTAVVHSQQAADSLQGERPCEHRYDSLSWSCSRWRLLASSSGCTRQSCGSAGKQTSMLLYWLPQQPKWPAVPSSCTTFVTGCSTQQLLIPILVRGGTGSCAGAPSLSGSRHTLPSARKSVEAARKLLWLMEMQSSAAAAARGTPAHLQCHCGGSLGTAVRCMILTSSAQASFAVPARQPWMACLSLF